jgi:hypothetical protein
MGHSHHHSRADPSLHGTCMLMCATTGYQVQCLLACLLVCATRTEVEKAGLHTTTWFALTSAACVFLHACSIVTTVAFLPHICNATTLMQLVRVYHMYELMGIPRHEVHRAHVINTLNQKTEMPDTMVWNGPWCICRG